MLIIVVALVHGSRVSKLGCIIYAQRFIHITPTDEF